MAPYNEDFPIGSEVRIADLKYLREFQGTWKYHNKLQPGQLAYAGITAVVARVGYYHGGDVLYSLRGIPGLWHEQCLTTATESREMIGEV